MMDAGAAPDFRWLAERLDEIRAALRAADLDGWLLYDLHLRNPVAAKLLGHGDLTRRYFVLIRAEGEPEALIHGIEEAPWANWRWARRSYVGWRELAAALGELVAGRRVAMEFSPGDAVPALDLVPAGVIESVREAGAEVVSSDELVTEFYARWTADELASHRRAAEIVADVAHAAFEHVAARIREGGEPTEGEMREWVLARLDDRGCGVGADSIVAIGRNAADPHYSPGERGAPIREGELLLVDLWSKEADDAIYADQTWMAYLGAELPPRAAELWTAVRDARDAAIALVFERWAAGLAVRGHELDDAARGLIRDRGYGEAFIHRTGHSIDRATHGMGPNIDNLETHETRRLVPGIGFSIEPGIYLPGEIGLRSEVNVYIAETGPEVTTPDPQDDVLMLLAR